MTKLSALGLELTHSIITLWLIVMALWALRNRRTAWRFVRRNIMLCAAIVASLAMAAVTFTAPRQLMLPSIFALILLLKICAKSTVTTRRPIAPTACLLTIAVVGCAFAARLHIYDKYQRFIDYASKGPAVAFAPSSDTALLIDRTSGYLLSSYAPDPLLNRGLVAVGDRYTIQGLQRTVSQNLKVILPYPTLLIVAAADTVFAPKMHGDTTKMTLKTQRLGPFSVCATPANTRWTLDCNPSPRGVFLRDDHQFFVTPPRQSIRFKLKQQKK